MIKGAENLTLAEMQEQLSKGAKFVVFQYAISIVIMTFRNSSEIHFVRPGEKTLRRSIGYSILTFFLGWWGFPWGPIYSIGALYHNFTGGKDVTADVLKAIHQTRPQAQNVQVQAPQRMWQTPPRADAPPQNPGGRAPSH